MIFHGIYVSMSWDIGIQPPISYLCLRYFMGYIAANNIILGARTMGPWGMLPKMTILTDNYLALAKIRITRGIWRYFSDKAKKYRAQSVYSMVKGGNH